MANPVQGYEYQSIDDDDRRNGTICKIERRADVSSVEMMEYGPAFLVRFGDDSTLVAHSSELHPWYPV